MKIWNALSRPYKLSPRDIQRNPATFPVQHWEEETGEYINRLERSLYAMEKNRNEWAYWGLVLRDLMVVPMFCSLLACLLACAVLAGIVPWR